MSNINKLADKWRKGALDGLFSGPTAFRKCAAELEAALPEWTFINPFEFTETSPHIDDIVVIALLDERTNIHHKPHILTWRVSSAWNPDYYAGAYWRPFCSIDVPPEDK